MLSVIGVTTENGMQRTLYRKKWSFSLLWALTDYFVYQMRNIRK